jgi:hypothetical protein
MLVKSFYIPGMAQVNILITVLIYLYNRPGYKFWGRKCITNISKIQNNVQILITPGMPKNIAKPTGLVKEYLILLIYSA